MEINRTILIADASEDFRSVLVEALRLEEGLDVVAQTGDGLEAIQLIREWKPDVLVMDLVLAGLTASMCWTPSGASRAAR